MAAPMVHRGPTGARLALARRRHRFEMPSAPQLFGRSILPYWCSFPKASYLSVVAAARRIARQLRAMFETGHERPKATLFVKVKFLDLERYFGRGAWPAVVCRKVCQGTELSRPLAAGNGVLCIRFSMNVSLTGCAVGCPSGRHRACSAWINQFHLTLLSARRCHAGQQNLQLTRWCNRIAGSRMGCSAKASRPIKRDDPICNACGRRERHPE